MIVEQNVQTARDAWFDEFIATIKTDQLLLDTDIANKEIRDVYGMLMRGNQDELALSNKISSHKYFVQNLILDYLKLTILEQLDVRLAFDFDNAEILVWANINDNDTATENRLLMIEAEVNAKYHNKGYDLTTTIVENRDKLAIPSHYIQLV
jgi:hypothetical protein